MATLCKVYLKRCSLTVTFISSIIGLKSKVFLWRSMLAAVVSCEHITKSYGDLVAVNDVGLGIEEGEIFGLVGPNGAGKTTLIEMIESLRTPDSGSISVLGFNPTKEADELQEKIGIQLQATSIQPNIRVKEFTDILLEAMLHLLILG